MEQDLDPADALELARRSRERLAARAASPWWYAPGYGLGCGGLVASLALPGWWGPLTALGCLLFVGTLYAAWRAKSGLSVNGYRRGSTRPVTFALLAAFALAYAVALLLRDEPGYRWVPLACGVVLAIVAGLASAAWDRAWRADMAKGL